MTTNQPAPVEPATITPAPFTEQQLCNAWNSQADHANDWDSLDIFEQLAWAQARAIAADRAGRPAPAEPADHIATARKMVTPPAEGEAGDLVAELRRLAAQNPMGVADPAITSAAELLQEQAAELAVLRQVARPVAIPGEAYDDDMGPVTWWRFPVEEAPWVGTPGDSDWPGYHTHFTACPPPPTAPEDRPNG